MEKLAKSLRDWNTSAFSQTLKAEVEALKAGVLPLHHAVTQGGNVDDSNISVTVLYAKESEADIEVRAGIFFTEVVGGCSCGDDPFSVNAYCEMTLKIDKSTAETAFKALAVP
ncbi:MAG: glucosamine--fructose-6-phosphate aminotransferase [Proteobacteria bacterium]|nr:glucosamine--fructose-6-phosphate aminotransferase [Pseudomonadota bacterium]